MCRSVTTITSILLHANIVHSVLVRRNTSSSRRTRRKECCCSNGRYLRGTGGQEEASMEDITIQADVSTASTLPLPHHHVYMPRTALTLLPLPHHQVYAPLSIAATSYTVFSLQPPSLLILNRRHLHRCLPHLLVCSHDFTSTIASSTRVAYYATASIATPFSLSPLPTAT